MSRCLPSRTVWLALSWACVLVACDSAPPPRPPEQPSADPWTPPIAVKPAPLAGVTYSSVADHVYPCLSGHCADRMDQCAQDTACAAVLACIDKCAMTRCAWDCVWPQLHHLAVADLAACAMAKGCQAKGQRCGDDVCDFGEISGTCPNDCGVCGDLLCGVADSKSLCPLDCDTDTRLRMACAAEKCAMMWAPCVGDPACVSAVNCAARCADAACSAACRVGISLATADIVGPLEACASEKCNLGHCKSADCNAPRKKEPSKAEYYGAGAD